MITKVECFASFSFCSCLVKLLHCRHGVHGRQPFPTFVPLLLNREPDGILQHESLVFLNSVSKLGYLRAKAQLCREESSLCSQFLFLTLSPGKFQGMWLEISVGMRLKYKLGRKRIAVSVQIQALSLPSASEVLYFLQLCSSLCSHLQHCCDKTRTHKDNVRKDSFGSAVQKHVLSHEVMVGVAEAAVHIESPARRQ